MTEYTHDVTQIGADATGFLHALGVRIHSSHGYSDTYIDHDTVRWRSIGAITLRTRTGEIQIRPHHDSSATDLDILRGEAAQAFHQPPTKDRGWAASHEDDGVVWRTVIYMPAK